MKALGILGGALALWTTCLTPVQAMDSKAKQLLMVDTSTNTVLMAREAMSKMYPSSMSKLMTLYVLFDKLKQGSIQLTDVFPVSEKAWRKGGSKMFVKVGTDVAVEDLIRGIIIQSGNDACIVVAEALGGSEDGFAGLMNEKAKALGLNDSHFMNSTGWPDEQHYMTARDLLILSQRLIADFPEYYHYFKEPSFTYSGITQSNRNRLLGTDIGVDGLKTGHTEIAGYGIALSAVNEAGRRLMLVVNGLDSEKAREQEGAALLRHGFGEFEAMTLLKQGQVLEQTVPVWLGQQDAVRLVMPQELKVSLPRTQREQLVFSLHYDSPVPAPIQAGDPLARLEIRYRDRVLKQTQLVAAESVQEAGFFDHLIQAVKQQAGL